MATKKTEQKPLDTILTPPTSVSGVLGNESTGTIAEMTNEEAARLQAPAELILDAKPDALRSPLPEVTEETAQVERTYEPAADLRNSMEALKPILDVVRLALIDLYKQCGHRPKDMVVRDALGEF